MLHQLSKKSKQHSLKVIRRFEEDIWVRLANSNKPSKILNYLFDLQRNNYKYKKLLRKKRLFWTRSKINFSYKVQTDDKELRRRKRSIKINNYLSMLKLRRFYGNLGLRKFKRIFKQESLRTNVMGHSFSYLLESRLDVILYRANFFSSIFTARQFINHRKIFVNGRLVTKPGYRVSINDIVTVQDPKSFYIKIKERLKNKNFLVNYPKYLEVNYKLGAIIFLKLPLNQEVPFPFFINLDNLSHSFLR